MGNHGNLSAESYRRKVGGPSVPVHLRLSKPTYDQVYAQAQRQRCSIPELIRRNLRNGRDTEE